VKQWSGRDIVMVSGRYFIANPDLVFRLKNNLELDKWNRVAFMDHPPQGATQIMLFIANSKSVLS